MAHKEKPLSPHISIYKPQISSVLSILHRITGAINFVGIAFMLWWILYIAYFGQSYSSTIVYWFFSMAIGQIVLIGWTFSLFFHLCTGIRYLFWNAGIGFSIPVMTKTGIAAVIMAALLTAFVWIIYYLGL